MARLKINRLAGMNREIVCSCGCSVIERRECAGPPIRDAYYVDLRCSECGHEERRSKLAMRAYYSNLVPWKQDQ
jgi:hypothetical protein